MKSFLDPFFGFHRPDQNINISYCRTKVIKMFLLLVLQGIFLRNLKEEIDQRRRQENSKSIKGKFNE